jgi:hypothetical protein
MEKDKGGEKYILKIYCYIKETLKGTSLKDNSK